MSGTGDQIPDELHVLAGEYVLGALDAAEMRAVQQQATVLPMLAAAIEGWERRLAPMTLAIPPLVPPEELWTRLEQAIGPAPEAAAPPIADEGPRFTLAPEPAPPPPFTIVPTRDAEPVQWPEDRPAASPPTATPPPPEAVAPSPPVTTPPDMTARGGAPSDPPPRTPANDTGEREAPLRDFPARDAWRAELARLRPPPQRPVWPWQVATAGAMAFAAGVAAIVLLPALGLKGHLLGSRGSPRVAVIMPADSHTPGFLAEARADGTVVLTAFAPVDVPNGKALELWVLPPGGTVPKSLGVLPAAGTQVVLPSMPAAGTSLLVSLEPPGGSPTGLPTGPVVYAGKLQQLQI
jgi:anti-sigma-K factor RskA